MPSVILSDNGVSSGSAGLKSVAASDGALALQTTTAGGTATTAVTIDTSQNVGFGTSLPSARLAVDSGSAGLIGNFNSTNANGGYLRFQSSGTAIGDIGTAAQTVSGSSSDFSINARPSGSLVFGTSNTERARFNAGAPILCLAGGNTSATGTGIAFPASQSASTDANTLDDYEEGTWTPTIYGTSTAGTQSGTRSGSYVKIGRFVYMVASFSAFTLSGAAGNIRLGGLPFSMTLCGGMSVYLEGIDPVFTGTPDNNITLGLRFLGGTEMAFGPTVSNGWDSYMSSSTTWTGGAGASTYGNISFWGIANS